MPSQLKLTKTKPLRKTNTPKPTTLKSKSSSSKHSPTSSKIQPFHIDTTDELSSIEEEKHER